MVRRNDTTLQMPSKSSTERREKTRALKRGRRRSEAEAKQMIIPTRGDALPVWKHIRKIAASRSVAAKASTALPVRKATAQITSEAQEHLLVLGPEAENEQKWVLSFQRRASLEQRGTLSR